MWLRCSSIPQISCYFNTLQSGGTLGKLDLSTGVVEEGNERARRNRKRTAIDMLGYDRYNTRDFSHCIRSEFNCEYGQTEPSGRGLLDATRRGHQLYFSYQLQGVSPFLKMDQVSFVWSFQDMNFGKGIELHGHMYYLTQKERRPRGNWTRGTVCPNFLSQPSETMNPMPHELVISPSQPWPNLLGEDAGRPICESRHVPRHGGGATSACGPCKGITQGGWSSLSVRRQKPKYQSSESLGSRPSRLHCH